MQMKSENRPRRPTMSLASASRALRQILRGMLTASQLVARHEAPRACAGTIRGRGNRRNRLSGKEIVVQREDGRQAGSADSRRDRRRQRLGPAVDMHHARSARQARQQFARRRAPLRNSTRPAPRPSAGTKRRAGRSGLSRQSRSRCRAAGDRQDRRRRRRSADGQPAQEPMALSKATFAPPPLTVAWSRQIAMVSRSAKSSLSLTSGEPLVRETLRRGQRVAFAAPLPRQPAPGRPRRSAPEGPPSSASGRRSTARATWNCSVFGKRRHLLAGVARRPEPTAVSQPRWSPNSSNPRRAGAGCGRGPVVEGVLAGPGEPLQLGETSLQRLRPGRHQDGRTKPGQPLERRRTQGSFAEQFARSKRMTSACGGMISSACRCSGRCTVMS